MGNLMPFQPIQPIQPLSNAPDLNDSSGLSLGNGNAKPGGMPFENYLQQALTGVNDSILTAGNLSQKAIAGQVQDLHKVTIASAEAEIMLKLATGITSKITSDANTLFQMQF